MNSEVKNGCVWVQGPVIIGAGPSGLAVAACLRQKEIPFVVIEKESCLASLWKLRTYDRLTLHLPKEFCELPFMPFPKEFPMYPTRKQLINYLEAYAKLFAIEPLFEQEAKWAKYDSTTKLWTVRTGDSEFLCRWIVVATGENAEPVLPNIPGLAEFGGKALHASEYKNGADFKESKVLVVGCGDSGMEIALDLCNNAAQVSLVVRDKMHILPKEVLGRSTFGLSMQLLKWFQARLVDQFLLLSSRLIFGDTKEIGIERPEIGPLVLKHSKGKTPVLDVGTMAKIKFGEIKVVPGIRRFTTTGAEFENGKNDEFEPVILARGYRTNVSSWLMEETYFSPEDGFPKSPFPNNWKGKTGVYSVGFNRRGLLGASIDARKVAEDISSKWSSDMELMPVEASRAYVTA